MSAANKEGTAVLYTNFPTDQTQDKITAFNKEYPDIHVKVLTDSTASLPARFQKERQSTGNSAADVLESSSFEPLVAANPSWFQKLTPDLLPSVANFRKGALADGDKSIITDAYLWQVLYNTNLVKPNEVPKTWSDILSPQWKGKLVMLDPRGSNSYLSIQNELRKRLPNNEYKTLAGTPLSSSSTDLTQKVAAGAYAIGLYTNPSKLAPLVQKGAPVKAAVIKPALMGSTTLSLPNKAPHPNAQRVLANFLLSTTGQEVQCKAATLGSLNRTAHGACDNNKIPDDAIILPLQTSSKDTKAVMSALGLK